jgi:hypothetical protein
MRQVLVIAFLPALLSVHLWVDAEAWRARAMEPPIVMEEAIYLPPVAAIEALSLSRPTVMADMLWLKAISYFAVHLLGDKEYRWLDPLIDTILELDPQFRKVYHWAAVVLMYGAALDNTTVRASIRILDKAIERFPDDWEFHFILGCNYYFELSPEDEEDKQTLRDKGIGYLQTGGNLPGAPDWLAVTVADMWRKSGQQAMAIRHLEEIYLRTDDKTVRDDIGRRLIKMKSEHAVEELSRERAELQGAWTRSYPFLSPDLFLLLGERWDGRAGKPWVIEAPPQPAAPAP